MFDDMVILFTYSKNGIKKEESFWGNHTGVDFKAELQLEEGDGTCRLKLLLTPFGVLKTDGIQIFCSYKFDQSCRILVNGYQSWSRTREYFTGERMKRIPLVAAPLKKTHKIDKYGDSCFYKYPGEKGRFHGYTYGYVRKGRNFSLLGSLTEKNGYTIIEYNTAGNSVNIIKECEGLSINTPYEAFDLIWAEGSESFVFDAWFDAMKLPKTACRPANGWTSWYNYYQKISEAIILENLENIQRAENKPGIFQIDDGYQTAVGDWLSVDADKFPNGMKHAADRIKAAGMKAGLWLAPFVCEKKSAVYREKKEWLLKDAKGRPVGSGCNWSGSFALDFYNKEVRDYIRKVFSTVLNEWGFDLVKLDFLYAVCLEPCRDKTRGAVMTEAMQFLRECAGDKILLGCGVPLGPSFGLADYCRIGCDIGPDWDSNAFLRFIVPEYVSTRNAVFNAIARRQLNNRAFLNDPDVFLLRDNNIKMSGTQKRTLFTANYLFGSLLFTSDNTGAYDDVQWELYNMTGRSVSRTITHVEQDRNGLIEIFFEEDGQSMLALINLGGRKAKYIGGPALGCEIVYGGGPTGAAPRNGIVGLKPCETRIFRLA
jgi:alpha-galactosidase